MQLGKSLTSGSVVTLFCAGVLVALTVTPAAQAQVNIGITIGTPPPPLRYEVRPVYPGDGYAWQDGYWVPYGGRYRWRRGIWVRQPYSDAYYVRPYYAHEDDGYRYRPGHWAHRGEGRAYGHFKKEYDGDGHDNGNHGGKEHHDNGNHGNKGHD